MIPYTHDADFGIKSQDLDNKLREEFLGKKLVRTWLTLGTIANSFEIRTSGCSFTFDIMVFYKRNKTTQCNSFHAKKVFSNCFPIFEDLCTAELFGHKFMVPCDPVSYLNTQYGKEKWIVPMQSHYQVPNTDWGQGRERSELELKYSFRYYDENGNVEIQRSLKAINELFSKNYGKNLTKLPNEDNLYL